MAMDLRLVWWQLERRESETQRAERHRLSLRSAPDLDGPINRIWQVRSALQQSTIVASNRLVMRFAGIDLSNVLHILLDACRDMALCWGGSVLVGSGIGAGVGFFFGGVGVIPGAAIGAAVGAKAGAWVLGALGLVSLMEDLSTMVPEALQWYERGFLNAWGPTERHPYRDHWHGIRELAEGHVLMVTAVLAAMMAYLTRGRGDKATLLQEIRQSRHLGPKVADWLVENEGKLAAHPVFKPREHQVTMASAAKPDAGPPMTPSQLRRAREEPPPEPAPKPQAPRVMPQKKVRCFEPNGLPSGSFPEFDRQLAGQERGINDMTVDEYLKGREAFDPANRDPGVARRARANYQTTTAQKLADQFRDEGMSAKAAATKAAEVVDARMKTLAALHNPDMIAGGKDVIADFGDRNINSRIGAQWKTQGRVEGLDEAAHRVPHAERGAVKMNAKLERCI